MSKSKKAAPAEPEYRCPRCDSIVPVGATHCVMCGLPRPAAPSVEESPVEQLPAAPIVVAVVEPAPAPDEPIPGHFESVVRQSRTAWLFWSVAALTAIALVAGWFFLRDQAPAVLAAFNPTLTPWPPTITTTPTWTPLPSQTAPPSATPAPTSEAATPGPTSTPREPRFHTVAAGETLFGLSLLYRISADSIAQNNGFDINTPIQSGQALNIPWPTATPPLESVMLTINGEQVLADATNCEIIVIQDGDSAYALSAVRGVPLEAIIAINRQTQESISLLQPGDTLCIPKLLYGDTIPPTAGPSPTPSLTPPPGGPSLLYPVNEAVIDQLDAPVVLQWTAEKDLAANEWYMVEVRDADDRDSLPHRGFTRDPSFRAPVDWRPQRDEVRRMQWTVSIVHVTGRRSDGGMIYTFGGLSSPPSTFFWQGAVPTATPQPTLTPSRVP